MSKLTVLSLGAGVQSSTMFLLSCLGELPKVDLAIFADTGAEPQGVYNHLDYLTEIGKKHGLPVKIVSGGDLEEVMLKQDGKFASVPFFVVNQKGEQGVARRQCTAEYKLRPIQRHVKAMLKDRGEKQADMWIGISLDEIMRMKPSRVKYVNHVWPLIDMLRWDRNDCLQWYTKNKYKTPPRSACVFCPYHNAHEWQNLKDNDKDGWERAVRVDEAIRKMERFEGQAYLHRQMKPLREVDFFVDTGQLDLFDNACEGMCGV